MGADTIEAIKMTAVTEPPTEDYKWYGAEPQIFTLDHGSVMYGYLDKINTAVYHGIMDVYVFFMEGRRNFNEHC